METNGQEIAIRQSTDIATLDDGLSIERIIARVTKVREIRNRVMKEGVHYGKLPGVAKDGLWQPGIQILLLTFQLNPQFEDTRSFTEDGHIDVLSKCILTHIPTGVQVASGVGSCSTREERYAYRNAARKCPHCGKEAIIKGKEEYGGGWLCFKKKDGCGAKFRDGDKAIEGQEVGKVNNENLADQYNTVVKMANIRSSRAAVFFATACSEIFAEPETALEPGVDEVTTDKPAPTPPKEAKAEKTAAQHPAINQARPPQQQQQQPEFGFSYKQALWDTLKAYTGDNRKAGDLCKELTGNAFYVKLTEDEAKEGLKKFQEQYQQTAVDEPEWHNSNI
jgi:hypothetical protein